MKYKWSGSTCIGHVEDGINLSPSIGESWIRLEQEEQEFFTLLTRIRDPVWLVGADRGFALSADILLRSHQIHDLVLFAPLSADHGSAWSRRSRSFDIAPTGSII